MRPFIILAAAALALAACSDAAKPPPQSNTEGPTKVQIVPAPKLRPVSFSALPGWTADNPTVALQQFRRVCKRFGRKTASDPASKTWPILGRNADWNTACAAAKAVPNTDPKTFVEAWFQPYQVGIATTTGLFTGYYEPEVAGSRSRGGPYQTPLYRKPADIISADLGAFNVDLRGRTVLGRIENGRLVPYHARAAVARGALQGQGLELVWLAEPVAGFFLEIQGSGVVKLPDGSRMRIGYAGKNGRPYRAIGRDLIASGAIQQQDMSMQAIRSWLASNQDQAQSVMNLNRSVVFFREVKGQGPIGAAGVPLAAGRSLAIDPKYAPLGGLVYIDVPHPEPDQSPIRRLVVAEDTGGAIKGPIRGDLFWGTGVAAGEKAGRMAAQGRYYLLAPKRR